MAGHDGRLSTGLIQAGARKPISVWGCGRMAAVNVKYPCVCCGHLTLDEAPGSHQICPVCFWEDDIVQLRWPDWAGGANQPCLIEAQQNFQRSGACDDWARQHVRPAANDEPLAAKWRPVDPQRDQFEPNGVALASWPDDRTVLYWWRHADTGFWWRAS
jgi:hypothetical protein